MTNLKSMSGKAIPALIVALLSLFAGVALLALNVIFYVALKTWDILKLKKEVK